MQAITTIGLDIAKSVFQVHGVDAEGNVVLRRQLKRRYMLAFFQNKSPGADKEANWLPAPGGPFLVVMRLYWPKAEALDGKWEAPPLKRIA